jgi:hypothetical protein
MALRGSDDHERDEVIRRLAALKADADRLSQEVERVADLFVERRKLGIDRRRHPRSDRRKQ